MVHARLGVAAENSGKLVSTVRREARAIAEKENRELIIVDGPPGIGCPVIASVTGASQVLVVTEPTVSGEHDLERVLGLTRHFQIPAAVCVTKCIQSDINDRIVGNCSVLGARIADGFATTKRHTAQIQKKSVVKSMPQAAMIFKTLGKNLNFGGIEGK
jgi:MinD superfamily P-loop ATPase